MRRIVLVLAVVGITAAMLTLSAPAFAADEAHHHCAVPKGPEENPNSCPDAQAAGGLGCAAGASGGRTPYGQPALCVHLVNNL
jgi:hypothetical protein